MTVHDVIKRPLVTEKGVAKKETELTLCFEVAPKATKGLSYNLGKAITEPPALLRAHSEPGQDRA